jgi:ribosomal protein S6E (S10)
VINIGVTTPGGTSNTVPFRVVGATVGVAGPTPALTTTPANTNTKTGTVTISNNATGANAGPLTVTGRSITKVGTAGGTFSITGGTCVAGFVINPGSNCTVNVQYLPGGTTTLATANVTVTDTGAATTSQTTPNFNAN